MVASQVCPVLKVSRKSWDALLGRIAQDVTRKNATDVHLWFHNEFRLLSTLELVRTYGGEVLRARYSLDGKTMWLTVREPLFLNSDPQAFEGNEGDCEHYEHDHGICLDCEADIADLLADAAESAFEGDR